MRSLAILGAIAGAALAAPAAAPAASPDRAANADREIVVYDDNTQTIVTFKRMNCRVKGSGDGRKFKAKGRSDGWELDVRANDFRGFGRDYTLEYGIRRTNFTLTPPGTKSYYSNFFFPGDQPPNAGGALAFGRGGRTMAIGFIAAFFSANDDQAVGIVGHAKCDYPKKR